jgi:SSS family solute:Na+ symporter
MQRALAMRRAQDAPYIPLGIGLAKLIFAFLIAMTGVAAPLVLTQLNSSGNWNATLPSLMLHYYSSYWLVFGFVGFAASLISTFSNNVAGFTSAWVQGIYQQWIRPQAGEAHYIWISRMTNAAVVILSVGAAYLALGFQSLMEYIQLILSMFNAPLFALMALAVILPRKLAGGGRAGFLIGLLCAVAHQILALTHVLQYGSQMAANFYGAIFGFCAAFACTLWIGLRRNPAENAPRWRESFDEQAGTIPWPALAAGIGLAGLCVAFNVFFW